MRPCARVLCADQSPLTPATPPQPFVYYVNQSLLPEPIPYVPLKASLPTMGRANQSIILPSDTNLRGFDIDFINLIFNRMLGQAAGWNIQFVTFGSFTEMWLGVLADKCNVAITASQMDPSKAICPYQSINATAIADYGYVQDYMPGDYANGGIPGKGNVANGSAVNLLACLNFGSPYVTAGFALLSNVKPSPFDVLSSLLNADVCNVATVIVIMACSAGFLVSMLESKNPHMGTFSRGAYWALFTFINGADEHPRAKSGRIVMVMLALSNMITVSIITSIISAKLTTASLSVTLIDGLKDVKGTLCVESNYPTLRAFVERDPNKPVSIISVPVEQCINFLRNGTVDAVITDQTVLSWYTSYYQLSNTHVSPVLQSNPFAFVYKDTALMQYVNPAVIAATETDANWIPATQALQVKYFGPPLSGVSSSPTQTKVNMRTVLVAGVMTGFAFLIAFTNGDWGRGLPIQKYKDLLGRPKRLDMSDEDAAKMGDEQALVRLLVKELREVKDALDVLHADVHAVKARVKHGFAQVKMLPATTTTTPNAVDTKPDKQQPQKPVLARMSSSKRIDQWVLNGMTSSAPPLAPTTQQNAPPQTQVAVPPPRPPQPAAPAPVQPPVPQMPSNSIASESFCGLPSNGAYVFPWAPTQHFNR